MKAKLCIILLILAIVLVCESKKSKSDDKKKSSDKSKSDKHESSKESKEKHVGKSPKDENSGSKSNSQSKEDTKEKNGGNFNLLKVLKEKDSSHGSKMSKAKHSVKKSGETEESKESKSKDKDTGKSKGSGTKKSDGKGKSHGSNKSSGKGKSHGSNKSTGNSIWKKNSGKNSEKSEKGNHSLNSKVSKLSKMSDKSMKTLRDVSVSSVSKESVKKIKSLKSSKSETSKNSHKSKSSNSKSTRSKTNSKSKSHSKAKSISSSNKHSSHSKSSKSKSSSKISDKELSSDEVDEEETEEVQTPTESVVLEQTTEKPVTAPNVVTEIFENESTEGPEEEEEDNSDDDAEDDSEEEEEEEIPTTTEHVAEEQTTEKSEVTLPNIVTEVHETTLAPTTTPEVETVCYKGNLKYKIGTYPDPHDYCKNCTCYTSGVMFCVKRPCMRASCGEDFWLPTIDGCCQKCSDECANERKNCPILKCKAKHRFYPKDSCCPVCGCQYKKGHFVPEGHVNTGDSCDKCVCSKGKIVCQPEVCPVDGLPCVNPERDENCNYVCPKAKTCSVKGVVIPYGVIKRVGKQICTCAGEWFPNAFCAPEKVKKDIIKMQKEKADIHSFCCLLDLFTAQVIMMGPYFTVLLIANHFVYVSGATAVAVNTNTDNDVITNTLTNTNLEVRFACTKGVAKYPVGTFTDPDDKCKNCTCELSGRLTCETQCKKPNCGKGLLVPSSDGCCQECSSKCSKQRIFCPQLKCKDEFKFYRKRSCCPECGCQDKNGRFIPDGPVKTKDPCDKCKCEDGTITCEPEVCPRDGLQCVDPKRNNKCRYVCPQGNTCSVNGVTIADGEIKKVGKKICMCVGKWLPNAFCASTEIPPGIKKKQKEMCVSNNYMRYAPIM
ncbi:hypothetical protein ACF0H5_018251 [Mactra antiquata]